jgi:hypothetical protein
MEVEVPGLEVVENSRPVVNFDEAKADLGLASLEMLDATKDLDILPDHCCVEITRYCVKWLTYTLGFNRKCENPKEEIARRAVELLDATSEDAREYVKTIEDTHQEIVVKNGASVVTERKKKRKQRLRKGNRTNFACSIAKMAYNKFGARPMSQANMLVTRRWLQKLLDSEEYSDLRVADKNTAIDRALFLSFVTSKEYQEMAVLFDTDFVKGRLLCRVRGVE